MFLIILRLTGFLAAWFLIAAICAFGIGPFFRRTKMSFEEEQAYQDLSETEQAKN